MLPPPIFSPSRGDHGEREQFRRAAIVDRAVIEAPEAPSPPPAPKPSLASSAARATMEWAIIIVAALCVAFLIKTFLIQAFFIPSGSMEPQLKIGDKVLVNKLSYRLHDIHRGDIIVFERPACAQGDAAIKDLIKRVIGREGDTVEGKDGGVFVNGKRLVESYLPDDQATDDFAPVKVPTDRVWVMGDNRENSTDSRRLCPGRPAFIAEDEVVGRAFVRVWPPRAISLL